jgi:hypothetical protein
MPKLPKSLRKKLRTFILRAPTLIISHAPIRPNIENNTFSTGVRTIANVYNKETVKPNYS